jgi:hypothetical protein
MLASHMVAKGVLKPEPVSPGWEWKLYTLYTLDPPELDATDGAHPAWWRGHDHGATKAAEAIIAVIMNGSREGTFANQTVEAAAAFARGMALGWEQRLLEYETRLEDCAFNLNAAEERAMKAEARVLELEDDEILELTEEQLANAKPLWQARVAMAFIAWAGRFHR